MKVKRSSACAAIIAAYALSPSIAHADSSWKRACTSQGQQAYAGCTLRNGRQVAFCAPRGRAPRAAYTGRARSVAALSYRAVSRTGRLQLRHPAGRFRSPLMLRQERFVRGERTVIRFRRGTFTYRYEQGVFGGRDAANSFHGMMVFRDGRRISLLTCVADRAPVRPSRSFTIVPGQRFGRITKRTTLRGLRRLFGARNVKVRMIQLPHGDFGRMRGAVVYPGTPREVKVVFKGRNQGPEHVVVDRAGSVWRTTGGIRIGTGLRGLERALGGPFRITGFGQDGGGSINSRAPAIRDLYIRLQGRNYSPRMNRPFLSSLPAARRARLRVSVIWWQPR